MLPWLVRFNLRCRKLGSFEELSQSSLLSNAKRWIDRPLKSLPISISGLFVSRYVRHRKTGFSHAVDLDIPTQSFEVDSEMLHSLSSGSIILENNNSIPRTRIS